MSNKESTKKKRWRATVRYRTDKGPRTVTHNIEELSEIHDRVELGPMWDTIERIEIVLQRPSADGSLTIEQAMNL